MASLSFRRKELSLCLEPRTLLALLSRRHAANQLGLIRTPAFACGSGTDTGHAGKGQVFLSLLAVTADNARFEAVELSAVGWKLKVSGEVSFQQGRAKVLRYGGVYFEKGFKQKGHARVIRWMEIKDKREKREPGTNTKQFCIILTICALASKVDSCCNRVTHDVRY